MAAFPKIFGLALSLWRNIASWISSFFTSRS